MSLVLPNAALLAVFSDGPSRIFRMQQDGD